MTAILDHYLTHVLPTGGHGVDEHDARPVGLPHPSRDPDTYHLRRVLTDPALLFTPDTTDTPARLATLMAFAWLTGRWDPARIPPDLRAPLARLRFLIWTFPARTGPATGEPHRVIELPDGQRLDLTDHRIDSQAQSARQQWLQALTAWEDDPWLAARQIDDPAAFERDLRWLVEAWPAPRIAPLPRQTGRLRLGPVAAQRRIAGEAAERWLERGSVTGAATALAPGNPWRWPLLAAYPLLAAGVTALAFTGHAGIARWAAVAVLALGLTATALAPIRYTPLALPRIPAAAAVGLALLLTLTTRWWLAVNAWPLGAALLAASTGYLMVEARQHGSGRLAAARRALVLLVLGVLHTVVLSITTLAFLVPVLADHGQCLTDWWQHNPWQPLPLSTAGTDSCAAALSTPNAAPPAATMLLMTGWSLSFGLAAQILWDDRPVTAPLGRLRRIRGVP
ncbi:hypothetical protein [Kutzneria buriramensis]|uniref:Uncharacterized protein n=1 Tax=Kutzneria buriramensis TaxID=1045776 RepID=A0A3E0HLH8_9PSEU|nr:hypothetical protein [Kutzneria buriramensis]REH47342.1 hypothetical protein BCF44_106507 [Kutzneria buriramensis]